MTMRAALSDPKIFGKTLSGPSWANWRVLLIASAGENLTPKEREAFQRFTGRTQEPSQRVEEAEFLIGRRGGKDRAASISSYAAIRNPGARS